MGRHAARNNCPFCGWYCSDVRPRGSVRSCHKGECYVECCACGARGPIGKSAREASSLWNERAEFLDRHGEPAPRVPLDLFTLAQPQAAQT